jgi:hypothetical protein
MTTTKETKHSFTPGKDAVILSPDNVMGQIEKANGKFPHAKHGRLVAQGVIGESGVVVNNPDGPIIAAVRHPNWIPKSIENGNVEFGNTQTDSHIERSFLIEMDNGAVQRHAKTLIFGLQHVENLREFSMFNEGAASGGSEPEAWLSDEKGSPFPIDDGGELQANCIEETIEPIAMPGDFFVARSKQILRRKEAHPDAIITDTSSMPTGSPQEVQVGEKGEIGPYVTAIQHKLWSEYMSCLDPTARELMDKLGTTFGYENWADMHQQLGNMAYLVFSASHLSIGLPHMRVGVEAMAIPEQEAIAVSDIFNTNFGTLAEMLMLSTPLVYGQTPTVMTTDGEKWPRDMRAIMRYTLDTTHPAEFIGTPQVYRDRVAHQIMTGNSHTMDRAAYMSILKGPNDEEIERPVMHGRVRLRATSSEPRNLSGRVEFTGCSASPSIYDEAARNSLLQLMTIGAYEALAEGMHPVEYFKSEFPSMGDWKDQKNLIMEANLHGFRTEKVTHLIQEGLAFAKRMGEKYPALKEQVELVQWRLANLWADPVATLKEYAANPQGPFSEVVQNEMRNGKDPVQVAKAIEEYQLMMANKFLGTEELV